MAKRSATSPTTPRVLLVGASTPIGRAITTRFVAGGSPVAGVSLEAASDTRLAVDLIGDCSTAAGAAEAVAAARDRLGGLDVVIIASARQPHGAVHQITDEDWRTAYASTVDVLFQTARAAVPQLDDGSAIVAVSSVNAARPAPWIGAYASAKAALEGLVRSIAIDYAASGIRCNAVAPGIVPKHSVPETMAGYPLQRPITPADVAEAVFFLGSPQSAAITGVTLPVDGGLGIASPSTAVRPLLAERAATHWSDQ